MIIACWIIFCLAASIYSRKLFPNQKELSRKIIHIGIGPVVPLAWWLAIPREIAISASSLITLGLILNYIFRFIPEVEDISRKSYGTIAYAISITTLLICFWPNNASAVSVGVLSMAFGDGLAGLIGRQITSISWKIFNQKKSLVGTLTMGFIVMFILVIMTKISGIELSLLVILAVSFIAMGLEQISFLGIDNLTVPIGLAILWKWITHS